MNAHILIVEDDPHTTELLQDILRSEDYSISIASNSDAALIRTLEHTPDLIILDALLPGIGGTQVAQRLRLASDNAPLLLMTTHKPTVVQASSLEEEADDYLIRPFTNESLMTHVKTLLLHNRAEHQELLHFADVELNTGTHLACRAKHILELSPTEYDLLELFLRYPDQVLPYDLIINYIWGLQFEGATQAVELYIHSLRAKLEDDHQSRLLHPVHGVGYVCKE